MESQKVKENRRAKFLAKMENKNKANKKEESKKQKIVPKDKPINENKVIPQSNIIQSNKPENTLEQKNQNAVNNLTGNLPSNNPETEKNKLNNINENNNNLNLNQFIENLNSFNNLIKQSVNKNKVNDSLKNNNLNNDKNKVINDNQQKNDFTKINFNEVLEKSNQFDYMISFQSFLKKILIIILVVIHCLNYPPLDNCNILKYTLIVLEISSLFFNKYYNDQKKQLTKNSLSQNNENGQSPNKIDKLSQFLMTNFNAINSIFVIVNVIKDIISDIAILFIINVLFFLLNKEKLKTI